MAVQTYTDGTALATRMGITAGSDQTMLDAIGSAVNDWIEEYCGRPIGPQSSITWTFDGVDAYDGWKALRIPQGIRTVSSLKVASVTGGTLVTAGTADYGIFPRSQDRRTGWPGEEIRFYDIVSGDVSYFWPGYANITVAGDGGWAAIPPVVSQIALDLGVRLWGGRQSGQADVLGNDEFGNSVISKILPLEYKAILRDYKVDRLAVG